MKYAAYERYAPSKSVWLDQLPSHWQQLRIKHVVERMESGVSVNSDASPAAQHEIGVLKTSCVYGDQFSPDENKRVLDDELGRVACRVKADRLIISRMNTPELVGSCGYVDRDFPNLFLPDRLWQTVFSKSRQCLPRFAWYYLTSRPAKSAISSLAAGTSGSMQNIGQDAFIGIGFPLPPFDEQQTIARFLDAKTAQIDALVAQKRQLIAKLKEKRSALIARTVTRGLPPEAAKAAGLEPNPEMKDSGVEWIAEIPAHWKAMRAKYLCLAVVDCKNRTPEYFDDGGYLVVRTTDVRDGLLTFEEMLRTDEQSFHIWTERGAPQAGDVVFTREAPAGEAAIFDGSVPMCLGQRMMYFRVNPKQLSSRYLLHWLYGAAAKGYIASMSGGSTVTHLRVGQVHDFPVATPPISEQLAIADYLDDQSSILDDLMERAQSAITRLTEYRQALITSAVTGKIDVRGLA